MKFKHNLENQFFLPKHICVSAFFYSINDQQTNIFLHNNEGRLCKISGTSWLYFQAIIDYYINIYNYNKTDYKHTWGGYIMNFKRTLALILSLILLLGNIPVATVLSSGLNSGDPSTDADDAVRIE